MPWREFEPQLDELQRRHLWLLMGGKLPVEDKLRNAVSDFSHDANCSDTPEALTGRRNINGNYAETDLLHAKPRLLIPYPQSLWFHAPQRLRQTPVGATLNSIC